MSASLHSQLRRGLSLLSTGNPKTVKGQARGYATAILHLAPAWQSGYNTCANHTKECAASCLYFAGRGAMQKIQTARIRKTKMFFGDRPGFLAQLHKDIDKFFYNALALNLNAVVRLNGTSDIRWEGLGVPQHFSDITFYDYTKIANRKGVPSNYHLTFSFSGNNLAECQTALANGMSVAVPFLKVPPATWLGYPVVDGDADDLRFLGDGPQILALKAKGRLRNEPNSPFLGENHNV